MIISQLLSLSYTCTVAQWSKSISDHYLKVMTSISIKDPDFSINLPSPTLCPLYMPITNKQPMGTGSHINWVLPPPPWYGMHLITLIKRMVLAGRLKSLYNMWNILQSVFYNYLDCGLGAGWRWEVKDIVPIAIRSVVSLGEVGIDALRLNVNGSLWVGLKEVEGLNFVWPSHPFTNSSSLILHFPRGSIRLLPCSWSLLLSCALVEVLGLHVLFLFILLKL